MTVTAEEPKPGKSSGKRLIISLGNKGGTGKSFLIRKLAELHMEAQTPNLLLVDGDASVSSNRVGGASLPRPPTPPYVPFGIRRFT
jgi:hypothetical protein